MRRWRAAHVDERRAYKAERVAGKPSRPIGRPRTRTGDRREYIQNWRTENRDRLREYAARPDVLARRRERYRLAKEGKSGESSRCTDAEFEDGMVMMREFIATGAHCDKALREQFPLFRGEPPLNHPYPEAWDHISLQRPPHPVPG